MFLSGRRHRKYRAETHITQCCTAVKPYPARQVGMKGSHFNAVRFLCVLNYIENKIMLQNQEQQNFNVLLC